MASTKYTYSVADDTLNAVAALDSLTSEIRASAIVTALDYINTDDDVLDIWFKDALSSGDETILDTVVGAHDGEALPDNTAQLVSLEHVAHTDTEKALKVATTKLEGSSTILVSHNFCDKTTWWEGSTEVTGETLETSDNLVYSSDHTHWIDLSHGKVPYEDKYVSTYAPKVYVDASEATTGFTIDYTAGTVTFDSSQEGSTVTVDYYYAVNNTWIVKPTTGKVIKMLGTDVKFTDDVSMPTGVGIAFQVFMTYDGTPDTLIHQTLYKNMDDFIKCTMGGVNRTTKWGDLTKDIIVLDFDYLTSKDMKDSLGMYIKISSFKYVDGSMVHTEAFTGTYGHVTANVLSLSE